MALINEYETGQSDTRPWGKWSVLATGDGFGLKRIDVAPGQLLSLQKHAHRDEHWVIVEGIADVTIGEQTKQLRAGDSVFIPRETVHRISNPGASPLVFIEVQLGQELRETDIERLEDQYGRH
ncbi:MAG: phosphomannose isomerase type II C-terminal cupin domain [Alphaproteobacteria bacterium]|nr:phosphomannose isomerase type II C-terminal cupin domain [Alphaproteobacteria bacterium]